MEVIIKVLPENRSARVKAGEFILDASTDAGVVLNSGCLNSTCGTCAVEILEGGENLSAMTDRERSVLEGKNLEPGKFRLACCTKIMRGEVVIRSNY
ncbi:MAG: (2Fe-2S)-binding protein [Verrucomicrobiae bacterium]|nr:(2Fe-2S)-binding protein [Verrucomicrobiae bacterium]